MNGFIEQFQMATSLAPDGATPGVASVFFIALVGAVASWAIVHLVLWYCRRNSEAVRSGEFHHAPTGEAVPRFGGVALAGSFCTFIVLHGLLSGWQHFKESGVPGILITSLAMFAVGLWDDIKPLGARKKLLFQIIIALAAYKLGLHVTTIKNPFTKEVLELQGFGVVITVVWLVAMTNLINLVDGIDGLAGGVSVMLMCLLAYVSYGGAPMQCVMAAGMAGALLGFLRFNFPPAKIYMGDGGAYFLGFIIGAMTIANSHKGTVMAALIAPVIALGLPIIDTAAAIVRRGLKGLPLFRADRKHIHHRLLARGLSRTKTVLLLYAISVVFLLMAFAMFWSEQRYVPIVFGMVFLFFLFAMQGRAMGLDWVSVGRSIGNSREMRRHTQYAMTLACWLEMEAERSKSIDALWLDFTFMARKVGFTRAKVVVSSGHRVWTSDKHPGAGAAPEHVFEFHPGGRMLVILQCSDEQADKNVMGHLSELTAEAWLKAVMRWAGRRNLPITFAPEAEADTGIIAPASSPT